jgi:glutamine synthetase
MALCQDFNDCHQVNPMETIYKWLIENRISEVEVLVPDMTGNARGKFIPADKFMKQDNPRLPEGILAQAVNGDYPDDYWELLDPRDRDMNLRADPNTMRVVPWANEPTAQIIHDCYDMEGRMHPLSTRNMLRRVLALYEKDGLRPVVAPEVEFYLVKKNIDPDYELEPPIGRSGRPESARQSYSIDAANEFDPIIEDMYRFCEQQKLDVDTLIHEAGAAQLEVNFVHGDALSLADQVFTFKRTMRETALRHNVYATFMSRPMAKEPGSSMHIHQSVVRMDDESNIFGRPDGSDSQEFMHFIAGLQKYIPLLIAFFAPNVNAYRRFTREIAAPISLHWGYDNRTTGLRVPDSNAQSRRIENRFPGADANPYLAIAASLAAGYLGMKQRLQPTEPCMTNAYEKEITVARSLEEGLRRIDEDEAVVEIFGPQFIRAYRSVKLAEYEAFNRTISAWEREHLLLNV